MMILCFFKKVIDIVSEQSLSKIIIGGDYNCVLNSLKDAHPSRTGKSKSATMLNNYLKNLNLVDAWRSLHPLDKEYSFYSAVHKSYSRIDLFVIDSGLSQLVKAVEYHNRLISDHSPLSLDLNFSVDRGSYSWRFDNSLLDDNSFHTYIKEKMSLFFTKKGDRQCDRLSPMGII